MIFILHLSALSRRSSDQSLPSGFSLIIPQSRTAGKKNSGTDRFQKEIPEFFSPPFTSAILFPTIIGGTPASLVKGIRALPCFSGAEEGRGGKEKRQMNLIKEINNWLQRKNLACEIKLLLDSSMVLGKIIC